MINPSPPPDVADLLRARASSRRQAPPLLRVAFASLQDPQDVNTWNGTEFFMARALEFQGADVRYLGELQHTRLRLNKAVNRMYSFAGNQGPLPMERSLRMARRFAREIAARTDDDDSQVILSPSSIPLAMLRSSKPKVFYTDHTFADLIVQYPELAQCPQEFLEEAHYLERTALANVDLAIYSSHQAANSAIAHYGADPSKVAVIPFGSNLSVKVSPELVQRAIERRDPSRCELLFLGGEQDLESQAEAIEIVRELNEQGVPARLTLVGTGSPRSIASEAVVHVPPFDRSDPWEQRRLMNLMLRSHFLLHPSRHDRSLVLFAEASSLGSPCLAYAVGGVPEVIKDASNGRLIDPAKGPSAFVAAIVELSKDRIAYEALARTTYDEYRKRLNWSASGKALRAHIGALL